MFLNSEDSKIPQFNFVSIKEANVSRVVFEK